MYYSRMPEHRRNDHLMKSKSPCCHLFFALPSTSLLTNPFLDSSSRTCTSVLEGHAVERPSILARCFGRVLSRHQCKSRSSGPAGVLPRVGRPVISDLDAYAKNVYFAYGPLWAFHTKKYDGLETRVLSIYCCTYCTIKTRGTAHAELFQWGQSPDPMRARGGE